MKRDAQDNACLLLANLDESVPNMLAPHAENIGAPLPRKNHQRECEPLARSNRIECFEGGDLRVGPRPISAGVAHLRLMHAERRIDLGEPAAQGDGDDAAQGLEQVSRGMRLFLR